MTVEVMDGAGDGGMGQRCSSPLETLCPSLRLGTEFRSPGIPDPSPSWAPRLPGAHSPPPPRLEASSCSSALLRRPPRRQPPPTWPREPAPRISAFTHQSAPAEQLLSDALPNQRPPGALAPPLSACSAAPRLKGSRPGAAGRGRLRPLRAPLPRLGFRMPRVSLRVPFSGRVLLLLPLS